MSLQTGTPPHLVVARSEHGVTVEKNLHREFFSSSEYRRILREQGVEVREEPVARDELYTADEIFLTGTAAEITPVRDIDHRKIGRGEAGPITRRVQEVFFSIVKGTDAKHDSWLTFV